MALGFRHDFPFFAAGGTVFRGWCLSALGQPGEGLRVLTEGIAHYRATGALQNVPLFLTMLAQAFGRAGRAAEGLSHLDQAEQVLNTTQERWAEVELRHVRGELLVAVGEHAAAKHSLLLAVSVASQQKAKLLELLATMSLARLLRDAASLGKATICSSLSMVCLSKVSTPQSLKRPRFSSIPCNSASCKKSDFVEARA
jgi:predicted ATPase